MNLYLLLLLFGLSLAENEDRSGHSNTPEQIHLSFGEKTNDIVVTWATPDDVECYVSYKFADKKGPWPWDKVKGTRQVFVDGGKMKRKQWIHRATLRDLEFDTEYEYVVGSVANAFSPKYSFKTPPAGEDWPVRIAIYGDMGVNNSKSLPYLKRDIEEKKYDLILHVGDFAYDMNEQEGRVGDQFMRMLQPVAARLPYMTCPGNHESAYNFSHYSSRFSMPGAESNLYYSFDVGPIHFVSISTEVYYFTEYGLKLIINQYEWLKKDLEQANTKENRAKRPWIILFGHRPMYCSNSDDIDCSLEYTRVGFLGYFGLEPLLRQAGVDLAVWAHEHSYERTWPLYDNHVYNGSYAQPYVNPRAPVHLITGSAGCREGQDPFRKHPRPWSAVRSKDYGYTRLVAHNRTHIHIEQVSVERVSAAVVDSFWLVKEPGRLQHTHRPRPTHMAPVHVVTGSAGCREGTYPFKHDPSPWSAFRSQDYGYTRLVTHNKTHIHIEQVSVERVREETRGDVEVIDSFWIEKQLHLPYRV